MNECLLVELPVAVRYARDAVPRVAHTVKRGSPRSGASVSVCDGVMQVRITTWFCYISFTSTYLICPNFSKSALRARPLRG